VHHNWVQICALVTRLQTADEEREAQRQNMLDLAHRVVVAERERTSAEQFQATIREKEEKIEQVQHTHMPDSMYLHVRTQSDAHLLRAYRTGVTLQLSKFLKKLRAELLQLAPQRDILEVRVAALEKQIIENEAKYGLLERSRIGKGMHACGETRPTHDCIRHF
jgi:hypothetical protein